MLEFNLPSKNVFFAATVLLAALCTKNSHAVTLESNHIIISENGGFDYEKNDATVFTLEAITSTKIYSILGPAISHHVNRKSANRYYNETHYGVGFEQRASLMMNPDWERSLGVSVLRDSFESEALFTTLGLSKSLLEYKGVDLRVGVLSGVAYKKMRWSTSRELVPYIGPMLVLRDSATNLGLTAVYTPQPRTESGKKRGIFTLQASYAF